MLQLKKEDRDQIVSYLNTVVVPAPVGANLMQIVAILGKLVDSETPVSTPEEVIPPTE